jgi:predicted GNAT superfamily acetyltransferase
MRMPWSCRGSRTIDWRCCSSRHFTPAGSARGHGFARRLYADLFARAGQAGHDIVVCEVNSDPPNPASDAFHAAQGFAEVGKAAIHQGSKTVRYLARALDPAPAST